MQFRLLFLAGACSMAGAAMAKCVDAVYAFSGSVVSSSGKGLSGARIVVTWREKGMEAGPVHVPVSELGAFEAVVRFDTYTATTLTGGDLCKEQLKSVRICASADGHESECKNVAPAAANGVRFMLAESAGQNARKQ